MAKVLSPSIPALAPVVVTVGSETQQVRDLARVRVSFVSFRPGSIGSHYHERACMTVVTSGRFVEHFRSRDVECRAGTIFTKPAAERHHDTFFGSRQLILEPSDATDFGFGSSSPFASVGSVVDSRARHLALRIAAELTAREDPYVALAVEGMTLELISIAARAIEGRGPLARRPAWLQRVRERLITDQRPATMSELASIAQVPPARVARVFRAHFGVTVAEFARRERLLRAVARLLDSDEPLSAIALSSGFADQSHFTRVCQHYMGTTPGQYRILHRP